MKHIVFVESNASGLFGIKTAKELGYYVSFVRSPDFEGLYKHDSIFEEIISSIDNCILLNESLNEGNIFDVCKELNSKKPIDAVISLLEYAILYVAKVAKRLNIPFTSFEAVESARDKSIMRKKIDAARLINIPYVCGNDVFLLLEQADKLGYPLIVKPAKGSASLLIKKANNYQELKTALESYENDLNNLDKVLRSIIGDEILIERFLSGEMFSLEIGVLDNYFFPFAVTDRKRYILDDSIELGGTMNADLPEHIIKQIHDYGIDFLKVMGLDLGIFHIEMILTSDGPVVIDPNARLIGGLAPKMLSTAIGHNIYEILIDIHLRQLDKVLEKDLSIKRYATDRDFACSETGILKEKFELGWLSDYYDRGLSDFRLDISPGEVYKKVSSNHDYIGAIVVNAATSLESKKLAEEILLKIRDSLSVPLIT